MSGTPSADEYRRALRQVVARCIFGVDLNPMAVELCKVNLWLEALEPGKPLSFLEHHIQCGNSLLGATPALLKKGIPDEAFKPIEGDDREYCNEYRRQNRQERKDRKRPLIDESIKLGNLADIPEGEPEIIGYFVEYSGLRFGMFFLAEFVNIFLVCSISAISRRAPTTLSSARCPSAMATS